MVEIPWREEEDTARLGERMDETSLTWLSPKPRVLLGLGPNIMT